MPIPKSGFLFPPGTNDWRFSVTGRPGQGPLLTPPPGVNDLELRWERDSIVKAWWTKDSERFDRIQLGERQRGFHFGTGVPDRLVRRAHRSSSYSTMATPARSG